MTASTASVNVNGVGTLFLTELAVNDVIMNAAGTVIGTVKSITSNTALVLTVNAAVNVANAAYAAQKVPAATDTVNVGTTAAHTVTVPAATAVTAAALTVGNSGVNGPAALTLAANTSQLTVTGNTAVNNPSNNNNTNALNANAGTANLGGTLTITGGAGNRVAQLSITTGTTSVTGNIGFAGTGGNARIVFTGAGTLNVGAALGAGGTLTAGTGTVVYNGTAAQNVGTYAYNNLTVDKANGTTASLTAVTLVGGNLTVSAGILDLNTFTANRVAAGGTITIDDGATLQIGGTNGFPTNYTTHTLGPTSTVQFDGTNQTVAAEGGPGYGHLILSGSGTKTAAGNFIVRGDLSITGVTFASAATTQTVNGNLSNTGTHTVTTGRITLSGGSAAHTLSGAGTYAHLELNDAQGATLNADTTVGTTLRLTNGVVATGGNTLITGASCAAPSVVRTNGWVNGNLRKNIPAGASTCTYEVGDASNYAPVVLVFAAGTGAGNLTGRTSGAEHPSIASSAIEPTNSVNRYWTFTNAGVTLPAAGYTATFNFVNGTPVDVDNPAAVGTYIVEQWNGSLWFPTTLNAACTATPGTHLCKRIDGETGFGDFAIGGPLAGFNANPGPFNTFESSTAAGAVLGRIYTKIVGTNINLSIVAVSNNSVNTAPAGAALTVDIMDSRTSSGTFSTASNCWSSWSSIQSQSITPTWVSGRAAVTINAPAQALRDARIRVTQGALVGCSTDRFVIRPTALTVTSSNANNNGSSGTPAIKTGASFSLTASGGTGYEGSTPSVDNSKVLVTGPFQAGTLAGTFNAAASGSASGSAFTYSEVGNFGLAANGVFDSSFTAIDQSTDCNVGSFSNALDGAGKYGCSLGSSAVAQTAGSSGFGRFIPDNFDVSLNTPQFAAACGTFTYVGQRFTFGTAPVITVTARNGAALGNAVTRNYAGAYMKMTNASLAAAPYNAQLGRYVRFDAGGTPSLATTTGFPGTGTDPAISFPAASATSGVGTLTFGTGTGGLAFARDATTPAAAFNADIALRLDVVDTDGVVYASNPVSFGAASSGNGIAFTGGKALRYGIVGLDPVFVPLNASAPVTIRAQYWAGSAFVTNTLDNCTAFDAANFVLHTHGGAATAANLPNGNVSGSGTLAAGVGRVTVAPPSPAIAAPGSARLCFDLDGSPQVDTSCVAATPGDRAHLQGRSTSASFNQDPTATVGFGLYGSQPRNFILFRENY